MTDAAQPVVQKDVAVSTSPNGDKLIATTTSTTATVAQPVNYGPTGVLKGGGEWAALVLALAALAALVTKLITKDVARDIRDHGKRLDVIEKEAETFRDEDQLDADRKVIDDKIEGVKHRLSNDLANAVARIHFLETGRSSDIERIVRLEENMKNLVKGQDEIKADMKAGFSKLEQLLVKKRED